jgi:hypothetical protein
MGLKTVIRRVCPTCGEQVVFDGQPGFWQALSTEHSAIGAFDGFAGEFEKWGHEIVRMVVKVKKADALKLRDAAVIRLLW